jgi:hypothetical protein
LEDCELVKSIDTQIEYFEQELRIMDENLIMYGTRVKAMKDYIIKLKEEKQK